MAFTSQETLKLPWIITIMLKKLEPHYNGLKNITNTAISL